MSAWVTLKNGRVLKYNSCTWVHSDEKQYLLRYKEGGRLIASIPTVNVERFEYERPCATYRQPRKDKLPVLK